MSGKKILEMVNKVTILIDDKEVILTPELLEELEQKFLELQEVN